MTTIGKTRRPLSPEPRGVLHRLDAGQFAHLRAPPPPELADRIEHFWRVRWNLAGQPAQVQETLPHPNVQLVVEPHRCAAWGVHAGRWTQRLEGDSQAFGIKFRPGAFRSLIPDAVSTLADSFLPATALFGDDAHRLDDLLACDDEACIALASRFLLDRLPPADPRALLAGEIVDAVVDDRDLHSAEALATRFGLTLRALQRLFSEYVGIGPKWVIGRYRLHEAIARVQAGEAVSWATLAQDLGYFDQAHFIADFKRLVGRTPGEYAAGHRRAPGG